MKRFTKRLEPKQVLDLITTLVYSDHRIVYSMKDDVIQDASWRMIRCDGRTTTYAKMCVRSAHIDMIRKDLNWRKRVVSLDNMEVDMIAAASYADGMDRLDRQTIGRYWREDLRPALRPQERIVMDLRLSGLKLQEISDRLGYSLRTLERIISHIYSRLRRLVKDTDLVALHEARHG